VYVIWRRSSPYPSFINFDAPERTSCVVQRPRTNTPLQALTLLNDPVYVGLAWDFAERVLRVGPQPNPLPKGAGIVDPQTGNVAERMEYAFRTCLSRRPTAGELAHLLGVYRGELQRFDAQPAAAKRLLGKRTPPPGASPAQYAAWFYITSILFNLDETVTRG
jgi:hypothetical protein